MLGAQLGSQETLSPSSVLDLSESFLPHTTEPQALHLWVQILLNIPAFHALSTKVLPKAWIHNT